MTAKDVSTFSVLDGAVAGVCAFADDGAGRPLIVFVHGGASDSSETLIPGHSQLLLAARNGYSAFAPDRPGYGGSAAVSLSPGSDRGVFAVNASRLYEAIAEIWANHGGGSPGVVVWGCSMGAAISLHLGALWSGLPHPSWPMLGIVASDIGHVQDEAFIEMASNCPPDDTFDLAPMLAQRPQPPTWTQLPGRVRPAGSKPFIPRSEVVEIVSRWPREWSTVAASVAVPVLYRLAEHDNLWVASADLVAEFAAALRVASPYVDAALVPGAAHAIPGSVVADEFNLVGLGFVARCHAASRVPELLPGYRDVSPVSQSRSRPSVGSPERAARSLDHCHPTG